MAAAPELHPETSDTVFSIHGKTLKFDTLESIEPYLKQLNNVPKLSQVKFGGNTLGIEASKGVADALEKKQLLEIADFSDIFTGRLITEIPQSLRSLCTSLLNLPALITVDFSDNAFGGRSVDPMLDFISNHTNLEELRLNNNGMGPAGGEMLAGALLANANKAKREGRKASLKTIVCGRNRLENGSSAAFSAAFAALGSLVEVRMFQNGIRMEGIEALSKGLRSNPGLEVLDFQDNTATELGSKAIAESLASWPKLRILNLSDCLLRPRGGLSIFRTLLTGTSPLLTSLKLQSNELNSASILVLARAIETHLKDLEDLELNGNYGESEEDECYVKIREALGKWGHEEGLDELDELEEEEEEGDDDDEEENEVEEEDEKEEEEEPKEKETTKDKADDDDLAGLLSKTHIA